jgi:methionyl-tRNA formyltransferase
MDHKLIFFGSGDFAAIILEKLAKSDYKPAAIITQPAKPVGRHQIPSPSLFKQAAEKNKIAIYELKSLKNEEAEKIIKSLEPDLIIVADYGKIIPKNILDIPKFGALNVHPSLLPKHRGATPIQYTILDGDIETGVTIILMDEQVDHGPIIASEKLKVKGEKLTYSELLKNLADLGGDLLIKILPPWFKGEIKPVPQDEAQATYTKILIRDDGKIDWQKTAEEIERQIRAFEKWPGSWCEWKVEDKNFKIKILKIDILSEAADKPAGMVFITEDKKMVVACGYGSLKIEELQLEGRKKITGQEFLRGYPKIIGSILF